MCSEGITHHSSLWTPVTQTHQHPAGFWISVWDSTWSALQCDTLNPAPCGTQPLFSTTLQHHKQHSKNTPAQNGRHQVFKVCSHFSLHEQVKASCERSLSRSHPRDTDCSRVWQPTAHIKLQPVLHDTSCNHKVWPGLKTRNHPVTSSVVGLTQSGRCPDYLTHNLFMPQYISRFHPKCSTGAGAHFPFLPMQFVAEIRSSRELIHKSLANHKQQCSL